MTTRILLDSNIIILASTGQVDIQRIAALYDDILVSIVSEVEVLGFNFPDYGRTCSGTASYRRYAGIALH